MQKVAVAVIGAGQAGLAMGYYLAQQRRPFVLLEAGGRVGQAWRDRYDSLRLFTPAWHSCLPGLPFPKAPDAYPTKDEVADYLERYSETFRLPVHVSSRVHHLQQIAGSYRLHTDWDTYEATQVVVATGPFQRPFTPAFSSNLAPDVVQLHSAQYRNPDQLAPGDVLVVGAGNSGAQIAAELLRTRKVYLAMGKRQPYWPQRLLGKDLFWWLTRLGLMAATVETPVGKFMQARDPLIGTNVSRLVREQGLELVGRVTGAAGDVVTTADGRAIRTANVVWATGFHPDYNWLDVPALDQRGRPLHRRGVSPVPGLYFLGLPWQHRRDSALLGGVGRDAAYLARQVAAFVAPGMASAAD